MESILMIYEGYETIFFMMLLILGIYTVFRFLNLQADTFSAALSSSSAHGFEN